MLTGDYPRLQRMRRMWGALPSPPRGFRASRQPGEILVSADTAAAAGLETTGLEGRTLELRGRDQSLDAWVDSAQRVASGAPAPT